MKLETFDKRYILLTKYNFYNDQYETLLSNEAKI